MSAIFSPCGQYRYRLDRDVQPEGIVFAYFGINPSTAGAENEDSTTRKWKGFTLRNGGRKYIAVNAFALISTDVKALATHRNPTGPDALRIIQEVIEAADVLVPCWGSLKKVPVRLRRNVLDLRNHLLRSGKPVKVFGWTNDDSPKHPLMLGYDTPLVEWDLDPDGEGWFKCRNCGGDGEICRSCRRAGQYCECPEAKRKLTRCRKCSGGGEELVYFGEE